MSTLIHWYPGDGALDILLVVTLAVALASSAAWLVSRRLAGQAELRHLVLFCALICCLASPALAWFCSTAGLTLVSIPILPGPSPSSPKLPVEQGLPAEECCTASGVAQVETDRVGMPSRQSTELTHVAATQPLPLTNTTIGKSTDVAVARAALLCCAPQSPSAPEVQRTGRPAETLPDVERASIPTATLDSFRLIATGAMFVWAAGTLLMLARLARNCRRVVQLRRSSRLLQNESLQSLLCEIAARLGMRRVPLLLVSSRTVIPLAVGCGRPAVILPELDIRIQLPARTKTGGAVP
jgi:hypothetical protein